MAHMTGQATPEPSVRDRSRARRLAAPLLSAGVVGALTVALHYRDPHVEGSWGACPTKLLTGLDCPGCGGLRAVNDLTNLDLAGAASSNLLFVLAIPLVLGVFIAWVRRSWRGEGRLLAVARPQRWAVALLVAATAFAVVRNLPVGGWLAA